MSDPRHLSGRRVNRDLNTTGKSLMLHAMRLRSRSAKDRLSNGLGSTVFFLIAIAILTGGCKHPRAKDDGANAAVPVTVSQLSPSLAGKRVTVRGKLFTFKCGQGIGLDSGQTICLVDMPPKPGFDDPFAGVDDKRVEATGTLRFYHDPTPIDETTASQRVEDHSYFEYEITQVRLVPNHGRVKPH
jgi:hypothetical protein